MKALLGEIEERFDNMPSEDQLQDYSRQIPSAQALREFAECWHETMPTPDDIQDYNRAVPSAEDLEQFIEAWDNLPSAEDVREYARAAGETSA